MFSGIWKISSFGLAIALVAALGTTVYFRSDAKKWHGAATILAEKLNRVVVAIQLAADNPDVDPDTAPGQVYLMGESIRSLKDSVAAQNKSITEMAEEAVRLRAKNEELTALAEKAKAQRARALKDLGDMTITPGHREDCETLVKEADDALDTLRRATVYGTR